MELALGLVGSIGCEVEEAAAWVDGLVLQESRPKMVKSEGNRLIGGTK